MLGEDNVRVGTTKNREGRVFYLTSELHQLLKEHALGRPPHLRVRLLPSVAARADGGRLPRQHSARLPANGHPEHGPGRHSGARGHETERPHHRTRSVFDRYNVVSDGDLRDAARRLGHTGGHRADAEMNRHARRSLVSSLATYLLLWYARYVPCHKGKTRLSRYLRGIFDVELRGETVERRAPGVATSFRHATFAILAG